MWSWSCLEIRCQGLGLEVESFNKVSIAKLQKATYSVRIQWTRQQPNFVFLYSINLKYLGLSSELHEYNTNVIIRITNVQSTVARNHIAVLSALAEVNVFVRSWLYLIQWFLGLIVIWICPQTASRLLQPFLHSWVLTRVLNIDCVLFLETGLLQYETRWLGRV